MNTRHPAASAFYSEASEDTILRYTKEMPDLSLPGKPLAAIVPHAGWFFSGKTAAMVFAVLKKYRPEIDTFLFFGAVHNLTTTKPAVYAGGAWETPFGNLSVNEPLAQKLLDHIPDLTDDKTAHLGEHSIEVSLPFIRYFYPHSDFVPVACPPDFNYIETAADFSEIVSSEKVFILATTDLTHCGEDYGFSPPDNTPCLVEFARKNDRKMIDLILSLKAESIEEEARKNRNACGSGAVTAACSAARSWGAEQGVLVNYASSNDVLPETPARRVVGYAGILLCQT